MYKYRFVPAGADKPVRQHLLFVNSVRSAFRIKVVYLPGELGAFERDRWQVMPFAIMISRENPRCIRVATREVSSSSDCLDETI